MPPAPTPDDAVAVAAAHAAAVAAGEPGYADPVTRLFVFTSAFLAERGSCCGSGCRHCPFPLPADNAIFTARAGEIACSAQEEEPGRGAATVRPMPPDAPDPADLAALAAQLACEAGALLYEAQRRARDVVETKSTATDMVTEMDRAAEALIVTRLRAVRPGDAVLGEEGGERDVTSTTGGGARVRWVVDPLDGTTNYLYGHPTYAVSIAAEVDGRVVAGAVYDPGHDELFEAAAGRGATRNGEPITVTGQAELATALVGTGFAYEPDRRRRQAEVLTGVLPHVRDIRRGGSAALDLCWVACGRLDAFFEQGLQPWDLAAGLLVVREAGGATSDLDGGPARPGCVLAAPPPLLPALRDLLRAAGAAH